MSARVKTAFDSIFSAALAAVLLTHRLEIRAAACANRESVAGFIDIIVIVMLVFEKVHEETKKVVKIYIKKTIRTSTRLLLLSFGKIGRMYVLELIPNPKVTLDNWKLLDF